MSDTVFDLKAQVSADATPFTRAMDASATSVNSSLKAISSAVNMYIGSSVVQSFVKAINVAADFGQVMADISSISEISTKKLADTIAKVGNEYGKMADIGNSIYETISSGIDGTEQELVEFTKSISRAAKSIRADIASTSNVVTTLTNAYGLGIKDVDKIADMLFVTVREGKAQGNELARTMGLVTNTAAEAGIQFEELSAAISILSRTQSASQSMIGLNQMLNGLINPTIEARKEAERWGIEIGATALKTKGFTGILTELHDKLGGNVEAINKILGNIRAMRAGVALTGKQYENFIGVLRAAEAEIGTGVAAEAFAKQTATTKQALENLETQVDKTLKSIGDDFEPITRHVTEFGEKLLINLTNMNGLSKFSVYLSVISGLISGIVNTVQYLKKIYTEISSALSKFNKGMTTSSDNAKVLRTEMQKTAEVLNMIESRMSVVGGLSSQQQIQRKFDSYRDLDHLRAQAISNLGIKHIVSKDDYVKVPSKLDTSTIYNEVYNRVTRDVTKQAAAIAQAQPRLDAKRLPDDYLSKESIREEARKRLGSKDPDVIRTDAMAKSMERATAVITKFSTAINNVNAHINAAFTPDVRRAELKALQEAKYKIPEIAQRNISQTYRRTSNGQLQDPLTGQFVNESVVLWREERRLKEELGKQIAARIAAERLEAEQLKAKSVADKRLASELQKVYKERSAEVAKAKAKEAAQIEANIKVQQALASKESLARKLATDAAAKAAAKNLKDIQWATSYNNGINARREAQETTIIDEMARVSDTYNDEEKSIRKQLANEEQNSNIVFRSRRRLEEAAVEKSGAASKSLTKYDNKSEESSSKNVKAIEEQRSKNLKALRRQHMAKTDQAALLERYNKRFGKEYLSLAEVTSRTTRRWSGSFNRIFGKGSVLTKLYNGFNAFNMAVSAAVTGWEIGKSLGEHMNMADSLLVKWIDKMINRINGESERDIDKLNEKATKTDYVVLANTIKINNALIDKLVATQRITEAEALHLTKLNTMNKNIDQLNKLYTLLQGKLLQATTKPTPKSAKEVYDAAQTNLKNNPIKGKVSDKGRTEISRWLAQYGNAFSDTGMDAIIEAAVTDENFNFAEFMRSKLSDSDFVNQNAKAFRRFAIDVLTYYNGSAILKQGGIAKAINKAAGQSMTVSEYNAVYGNKFSDAVPVATLLDFLNKGRGNEIAKVVLQQLTGYNFGNDITDAVKRVRAAYTQNDTAATISALQNSAVTYIPAEVQEMRNKAASVMQPFDIKATKAYKNRGTQPTDGKTLEQINNEADIGALTELMAYYTNIDNIYKDLKKRVGYINQAIKDNNLQNNAGAQAAQTTAREIVNMVYVQKDTIDKELNEFYNALISNRENAFSNKVDNLALTLQPSSVDYSNALIDLLRTEITAADSALTAILRSEQGKQLTEPQKQALRRTYNNYIIKVREQLGSAVLSVVDDYTNAYSESIADIENKKAINEARNKIKDISEAKQLDAAKRDAEDRLRSLDVLIGNIANTLETLDADKDAEIYNKLAKTYNEYQRQSMLLTAEISSLGKQITLAKQAAAQQSNIALMAVAQSFASQRSNGMLDNNALYHSLNLTARVGQTNMMRSLIKGTYAPNSINVNKAMMNREKAQQAVSASIDSYMMSQKYAEANMGKTIVDIYNYMRNNNTTMVRR